MTSIEKSSWAKDAGSFDEYRRAFYRMMREAELLDVRLADEYKRHIFIRGLPDVMQGVLRGHLFTNSSVSEVIEALEGWLFDQTENPFAVVKKTGMRAIEESQVPVSSVAAAESKQPSVGGPQSGGNIATRPIICYGCGKVGHIRSRCPEKNQISPSAEEAKRGQHATGQQEVSSSKEGPVQIQWKKAASLRLAGASVDRKSPRAEVTLSDARGQGVQLTQSALLDTGAEVTCCTKEFADELYRRGVVTMEEIDMCCKSSLTLADEATVIKPLGTVAVDIEGTIARVLVVPARLCADLIVGFDLLANNEKLFGSLVQEIAESGTISGPKAEVVLERIRSASNPGESRMAGIASAEWDCGDQEQMGLAAAVSAEPGTASSAGAESHCEWPPVELRWKQGAKEALKSNLRQAKGEAKQLYARMIKKSPKLLQAYQEVFDTWISNGWLEAVAEEKVRFCLRHFGVEKDKEGPTAMARCRVVVDGSGLTPLLSVPECTHTDTVKNLLVWRSCDVFTALDVSQAYMRIRLQEEDTYFLCICWGGRFFRFRSIPMGIAPSAQILQEIIDAYVAEYCGEVCVAGVDVRLYPYMDDLVQCGWCKKPGLSHDAVAEEMEVKLTAFLSRKRMKISEGKTLRIGTHRGSLLGVRYQAEAIAPSSKLLKLARGDLLEMAEKPMSRREAVGLLSSVYDPLGLAVELQMRARILASQLSGLAWDRPITRSLAIDVCKWIELCQVVLTQRWPRKLTLKTVFVFTDASSQGISCVVLGQDDSGGWQRLLARARVYKKYQRAWTATSSKIELLALQLGVETAKYVVECTKDIPEGRGVQEIVFGTDSEVNFNRLASRTFAQVADRWEARVAICVNNGIANLRAGLFHVPGQINPADGPSRGSWMPGSQADQAVSWFREDRAVWPEKYQTERIDVMDRQEAKTSDTGEVDPGLISAKVNCSSVRLGSEIPSLEARFAAESQEGRKADWLRVWQESDSRFADLVRKGTIRLEDDVWTLMHRQTLEGTWQKPVFVPAELVKNALVSVHDEHGHFGFSKSLAKARSLYFWPRMSVTIKAHCRQCLICQQIKGAREWQTDPQPVAVDGTPWSVVGVDVVKGFDSLARHIVLTATCLFTRYVFTFLLPKEEARRITAALEGCFALEGCPRIIVTDNGAVFTSEWFRAFLMRAGIRHHLIPRHAPWYGGFYEVSHKCLTRTIVALMLQRGSQDWKKVLSLATFLYNARPYEHCIGSGVTLSPHEVFRGRPAEGVWRQGELDVEDSLRISDADRDVLSLAIQSRRELLTQYEEIWKQMRHASAREIARRQRGTETYRAGDSVMIYVPRIMRSKSEPKWAGPFVVEAQVTPTTWVVNGKAEHGYNLKRFHGQPPQEQRSKRRNNEESLASRKRARLATLRIWSPRGELLWLQ